MNKLNTSDLDRTPIEPSMGDAYRLDSQPGHVWILAAVPRGYTLINLATGGFWCSPLESVKELHEQVVGDARFIYVGPVNLTVERAA